MLDTIVAIATAPGKGGVGIIRVSGKLASTIAHTVTKTTITARGMHFCSFFDGDGCIIDSGLLLNFIAPQSFTGEDVVEFQAHGGPVILDCLLQRILSCGARMAKPGEFSERAFLNDKMDLAQCEAVADLIDAGSTQAARLAARSLQGEFSKEINVLVKQLTELRMYVEAAIDFPDEEVDFLNDGVVATRFAAIIEKLLSVSQRSHQGSMLREGLSIVLAGMPNAGKSTLINCFAGRDLAIVTDIPGTTRDVMKESINLDGIPLHIIDTAGLRESDDPIEQEGIKRAWQEIEQADCVILLVDIADSANLSVLKEQLLSKITSDVPVITVLNKIDSHPQKTAVTDDALMISAKTGFGMDALKEKIKQTVGVEQHHIEGAFIARRRHLDALDRAQVLLDEADARFKQHLAGELLAEDLRQAQMILSEITGEFTSDDLLGEIFSSFCIGK